MGGEFFLKEKKRKCAGWKWFSKPSPIIHVREKKATTTATKIPLPEYGMKPTAWKNYFLIRDGSRPPRTLSGRKAVDQMYTKQDSVSSEHTNSPLPVYFKFNYAIVYLQLTIMIFRPPLPLPVAPTLVGRTWL